MSTPPVESSSRVLGLAPTSAEPLAAKRLVVEEVITPEQFFVPADQTWIAWTPERRLLLAVLEDAVVSCLRYRRDFTTRGKRLFRETLQWFASTDRTSVCTFESICDHLHLDADYLRQGLWRQLDPQSALPVSLNELFRRSLFAKHHLPIHLRRET